MRKTIAIGSAALASLALVALPTSSALASKASVDVPPGEVTVNLVAANGSGCPAGSAVITVQPDKKAFTVSYSKYTALVGVGAGAIDFRKNCQLAARLHVPQGFSFAIAEATYRGFAVLKPGVKATEGANYYFSGEPQTTIIKHNIPGPLEDPWVTNDKVPFASLEWSRCGGGRDLNINTSLLLTGGPGPAGTTSTITMDSSDVNLDTIFNLAWKKC